MLLRKELLNDFTLPLDMLDDIHWLLLLKFAKGAEVLSTLRSVGDVHWARAVASALGVCLAGICPAGKDTTGDDTDLVALSCAII